MTLWQTFYTPTSIEAALQLLSEHGSRARLIAGGTDLMVELRNHIHSPEALIDISRVPGLNKIKQEEDTLHLGPLVTHNRLVASDVVRERAFPLAQAAWSVGSPQIRNLGTLGGNLVTASPANDTIPALWALGATVTLRSIEGERTLPLPEFFQGVRKTAITPQEMLTEIQVPVLAPGERGIFVKLGLRRAMAISLVNAAVILRFEGRKVTRARITLGSVAPTIIRAPEAEGILVGGAVSMDQIERAAALAAQAASPIDDIRSGADYRRQIVRVLVQRALMALIEGREQEGFLSSPPLLWGNADGQFPRLTGKTVCHTSGGDEPIECTVNGENHIVREANGKNLLRMLRDDLGFTGTKEGCAEGECGACTIWLNDIAVLSCLIPAPRAHGAQIKTIEDIAQGDKLHPLQQAFIDEGAVQCGYCTPGFIMSGAKLLEEFPHPSRDQILHAISGNLCRCTGYYKIVQAIEKAAQTNDK